MSRSLFYILILLLLTACNDNDPVTAEGKSVGFVRDTEFNMEELRGDWISSPCRQSSEELKGLIDSTGDQTLFEQDFVVFADVSFFESSEPLVDTKIAVGVLYYYAYECAFLNNLNNDYLLSEIGFFTAEGVETEYERLGIVTLDTGVQAKAIQLLTPFRDNDILAYVVESGALYKSLGSSMEVEVNFDEPHY